jgi:uncharacterized protein (DUF885 family)
MTDIHQKAQRKVFQLMVKNNQSQDEQVETIYDDEKNDNLIDLLNDILTALVAFDSDLDRFRITIEPARRVPLKGISDLPKISTNELTNLLKKQQVIKDFNPSKTELKTIDDIQERLDKIDEMGNDIDLNIEIIKRIASGLPKPQTNADNRARYTNRQAERLFEFANYNFEDNILKPLDTLTDVLKTKLQTLEVEELTGHGYLNYGGVHALKFHPMYQPKKFY